MGTSGLPIERGDVMRLPGYIAIVLLALMLSLVPAAPRSYAAIRSDAPEWFDDAVVYEIFVRSFYDSDGDGIGDLRGVIEQLDYVESLGADVIWLMPVLEGPTYHGYEVTDYYAIEADYGTEEDFLALLDAAHSRGIRVIMDFVIYHVSSRHPFFTDAYGNPDSRYSDWFIWRDEAHTSYETFMGVQTMPRLNHENPEVLAYVTDVALHWLDPNGDGSPYDGVDGFRCDVAIGVPHETWAHIRDAVKALRPDALMLGEVWTTSALEMAPFFAEFDALFDFPLYSVASGANDRNGDGLISGRRDPRSLELEFASWESLYPSGAGLVHFLSNHDTNRIMSEVGGDVSRAKAAAVFVLTLPGTPMIYYGEEIGMCGEVGRGRGDEYRREPMDWYASESGPGMTTWFRPDDRCNAPFDGISVEEEDGDPDSLLSLYRTVIALRRTHPALVGGEYAIHRVPREARGVWALWRWDDEEAVLIAINFDDEMHAIPTDGDDSPPHGREVEVLLSLGAEVGPDGVLTLAPTGAVILQWDR